MKVLIIADNLGNNAPGFVFCNLINGLSKKINFDLITSTENADVTVRGKELFIKQNRIYSTRLSKLLFSIFGFHITQYLWSIRVKKYLRNEDYDVVISLMSSSFYASLMAADMYCRHRHVNHICYCVDAVPAPWPWETNRNIIKATKKFIKNYFRSVRVLAMTNSEMLNYQKKLLDNINIETIVIHNPPQYNTLQILDEDVDVPAFAYAGNLYGIRDPRAMIEGFYMFSAIHPDCKFYFIGKFKKDDFIKYGFSNIENIEFIDYTRNLKPIFNKCIGLVDVNANIDNDVFLSSKVLSYLPYTRLIISESGLNSPVRSLFAESKTVIHVSHDKNEYLKAFEFCYQNYRKIDFSERNDYLAKCSMDSVTDILISKFTI